MDQVYYLADAFEFHLRLLKDKYLDLDEQSESGSMVVLGASSLLTKFIKASEVIDYTSLKTKSLWIQESEASKLIQDHFGLYPNTTPTTDFWVSSGIIELKDWNATRGFLVRGPEATTSRALANLWEELLLNDPTVSIEDKFRNWCDKAACLRGFNSPGYFSKESRELYLDTALDWILKNPSSKLDGIDLPPAGLNPIEYLFWFETTATQRARQHRLESDRSGTLINQIIKFDDRHVPQDRRFHRIRQVITSRNPYNVCKVSEALMRLQPLALASILADHETLSFGLALLERATLPEPFAWQALSGESRTTLQEEFRYDLWKKATEIVSACFIRPLENWNSLPKANSLWEILRYLAHRETEIERQISFRPDLGEPQKTSLIQRRHHLLSALGRARHLSRIHTGQKIYSPRVFNEFVPELLEICSMTHVPIRESFEAMPNAEIETLLWVINEILDDLPEKQSVEPLLPTAAVAVIDLYSRELKREFYGIDNTRVNWTCEADVWSNLNWINLVFTLFKNNQLASLLKPLDFEGHIRALPDSNNLELWESQSNQRHWAYKIRTHLRLLLQIRSEIGDVENETTEQIKLLVEEEISDLVKTFTVDDQTHGRIDVFKADFESETSGLVRALKIIPKLSKALNHFSSSTRSQIIRALQGTTSDLNRLIGLAGELRSHGARSEVELQLKELLKKDPLQDELWLTRIEQMAVDSANYGLIETSKFIVQHGDQITDGHPYRTRWEEIAFQIKLLIAYNEEDRVTLETLPMPELKDNIRTWGEPTPIERLEKRRQFLLSLLNLKTDPDRAAEDLAAVVGLGEKSLEYTVNLFRARIQVALKQELPLKKQKLKEALDEWLKMKTEGLALLSNERKASFAETMFYNELETYIHLDDATNALATFYAAPSEYRFSLAFLQLIAPFLSKEEKSSELKSIADTARDFHRSASGRMTDQWLEIEKLMLSSASATTRPQVPLSANESELRWELMRQMFPQLRRVPPPKLVSIIRGEGWDVGKFVLKELLTTLHTILDQAVLFKKFPDFEETDQTLLLAILMKMRLEEWGLWVTPESIGGETTTGSAGFRDLTIESHVHGKLSVIEALKLDSVTKGSIKDHLSRLFTYDATGDDAGFLVSFVTSPDFEDFWRRYKVAIQSSELELMDSPTVDAIREYQDSDVHFGNRVKIGLARHSHKGILKSIYHILVHTSL